MKFKEETTVWVHPSIGSNYTFNPQTKEIKEITLKALEDNYFGIRRGNENCTELMFIYRLETKEVRKLATLLRKENNIILKSSNLGGVELERFFSPFNEREA